VLDGQLVESAADSRPGRVDEDVQPPVLLAVLVDDALAVFFVSDIGCDGKRPDLPCRAFDLLARACCKGERKTFLAQHVGDREPDAGRAPGDERRLLHAPSLQARRGHRRRAELGCGGTVTGSSSPLTAAALCVAAGLLPGNTRRRPVVTTGTDRSL
jgi:hypothetical protein